MFQGILKAFYWQLLKQILKKIYSGKKSFQIRRKVENNFSRKVEHSFNLLLNLLLILL